MEEEKYKNCKIEDLKVLQHRIADLEKATSEHSRRMEHLENSIQPIIISLQKDYEGFEKSKEQYLLELKDIKNLMVDGFKDTKKEVDKNTRWRWMMTGGLIVTDIVLLSIVVPLVLKIIL